MITSIKVSPMNSIVFIDGGGESDTPVTSVPKPDLILATDSCISVGTLMEFDGETNLSLGHVSEFDVDREPAFDGFIENPEGQAVVSAVDKTIFLLTVSGTARTRISIWINHPTEPDEIAIGYDRA